MLEFNYYEAEQAMEERVKDALREVKQDRLIRLANSARPGLPDRVLASIGGLLISTGRKLQGRHAPVHTGFTGSPSPASQ
jgi:hypothetical protein